MADESGTHLEASSSACETRWRAFSQLLLSDNNSKTCSVKLITERQNAVSALNGYFDQRDELNQKIQAKMAAERQECCWSDCARETEGDRQLECQLPRVFFLVAFKTSARRMLHPEDRLSRSGDVFLFAAVVKRGATKLSSLNTVNTKCCF